MGLTFRQVLRVWTLSGIIPVRTEAEIRTSAQSPNFFRGLFRIENAVDVQTGAQSPKLFRDYSGENRG
jgi:hypothetical protein